MAGAGDPSGDILMWEQPCALGGGRNTSLSFKHCFQSLFSCCCILTATLSEPPWMGLEERCWSPAPLMNVPKASVLVLDAARSLQRGGFLATGLLPVFHWGGEVGSHCGKRQRPVM